MTCIWNFSYCNLVAYIITYLFPQLFYSCPFTKFIPKFWLCRDRLLIISASWYYSWWYLCFWTQGSDFVPTAIDVAVKELIAVATPGQGWPLFVSAIILSLLATFTQWPVTEMLFMVFFAVGQKQLDRAKQSTKSAILMNLESRVCKLFSLVSLS